MLKKIINITDDPHSKVNRKLRKTVHHILQENEQNSRMSIIKNIKMSLRGRRQMAYFELAKIEQAAE